MCVIGQLVESWSFTNQSVKREMCILLVVSFLNIFSKWIIYLINYTWDKFDAKISNERTRHQNFFHFQWVQNEVYR
jgi:hypothetical protein